jgi:hypothetical protein
MLQRTVFNFIGHELAAVFGSLVAAFAILSYLDGASSYHQHSLVFRLAASQYSPAFWIPGLFLGFAINYHTRDRSAYWMGIINVLLFVALFFVEVRGLSTSAYSRKVTGGNYWHYAYCEMFSLDAQACGADAFARLFITGPVLGSVAYALGAKLAFRYEKDTVS